MTGRERVRARIGFIWLVAGFSRPYAGLRSGARRVARSVDLVERRAGEAGRALDVRLGACSPILGGVRVVPNELFVWPRLKWASEVEGHRSDGASRPRTNP